MDAKLLTSAGLALGLTAGFVPLASAADPGWYVGINAGQSKFDTSASKEQADLARLGITATGTTIDDTDTGWKLFAGYQFNPNFAVEGGYVDLGKVNFSTRVTAVGTTPTNIALSGDVKTKNGLFIDAVGIVPLQNNFSLFGRLGIYSIKTEASGSASSGAVTASASESSTDSDLHWGIGAGYDFTKNVGARLEWERFNNVGNKDKTGEANVDLLSVGIVYKF